MKKITSFLLAVLLLFGSIFAMPLSAETAEAAKEKPTISSVYINVSTGITACFSVKVPKDAEVGGLIVNGNRIVGEKQEDGTYFVSYGLIACHQLADIVWVTPWSYADSHLNDGDEYLFSPVDYANRLLRDPALSAPTRRVLVALLNYGAMSQRYFTHNPYNLANAYLSPADRVVPVGSYADRSEQIAPGNAADFELFKAKIYLDDFLHFELLVESTNPDYAMSECRVQVSTTPDFASYMSYPLSQYEENHYISRTDAIPYDALRERVYVRAILPSGEYTATVSYSIEAYAREIASESVPTWDHAGRARLQMIHAMMELSDALHAYKTANA